MNERTEDDNIEQIKCGFATAELLLISCDGNFDLAEVKLKLFEKSKDNQIEDLSYFLSCIYYGLDALRRREAQPKKLMTCRDLLKD